MTSGRKLPRRQVGQKRSQVHEGFLGPKVCKETLTGRFSSLSFSYLAIYLAVPGLEFRHAGSLAAACKLYCGMGSSFLGLGLNPGLLHWERWVLATRPPGKSPGTFSSVGQGSLSQVPCIRTTLLWTEALRRSEPGLFSPAPPVLSHDA